jgi:hypothetical protein
MSEVDQRQRIRRILENALSGCTYVSSKSEAGDMLVLKARRANGRGVTVRFRAVRDSEATDVPSPGEPLRLRKVGSGDKRSLIGMLLPILRPPGPAYARVTIEAGTARMDIVCQDAEWWEDEA